MVNERRAALEQACRAMGVSILYAFGSRADEVANWLAQRQQELPPGGSDVDIGARAAPGVFWQVADKVRLAIALEDLFDCPRVDLVVLNEADPFVGPTNTIYMCYGARAISRRWSMSGLT